MNLGPKAARAWVPFGLEHKTLCSPSLEPLPDPLPWATHTVDDIIPALPIIRNIP